MKAVVEIFGGIPEKVYLVTDEISEETKKILEKQKGITTQEERDNRALNGKEEFHIVDVDIVVERGKEIVIIGDKSYTIKSEK